MTLDQQNMYLTDSEDTDSPEKKTTTFTSVEDAERYRRECQVRQK